MGEAIKHCLGNLTNFDGRDPRRTFWFYVLFLVIINVVLAIISGIVFAGAAMGDAFSSAASGADQMQVQAQMYENMASTLTTQAWFGAIVSLIMMALFIAAFVRRLRDAGIPVWVAAIPVITTLVSIYSQFAVISTMEEAMTGGDIMAINEAAMSSAGLGLVGWLGYIVVIVCGVLPTKNAPAG